MQKTIVILGPTCSNKTNCSFLLSELLSLNIVNFDTRQFLSPYRHLTASPIDKNNLPHFLFNCLEEKPSLGWWAEQISQIKNKLLVGGSAFYPFNLYRGIPLYDGQNLSSVQYEWKDLANIDLNVANTIHPNNLYRINQYVSFYKKYGIFFDHYEHRYQENLFFILLNPDLDSLRNAIRQRTPKLFYQSLEKDQWIEAEYLRTIIGYEEFCHVKKNLISIEEAINSIIIKTIHYAKKQCTFLRSMVKKITEGSMKGVILKKIEDPTILIEQIKQFYA